MATNEIGAVVKLEGEKQFREEMRQITQQTKLMHSELSAMEATWGKDASAIQKATDSRAKLNSQIEKQREIIATARENVRQYAEATGENSSQTLRWKNTLADAEAELRKLEGALRDVPNRLQIVGKAMQETGAKIKKVGNSISSVGSTLTRSVTAPVLAAGTAAVKLASDYDENLNKVDASFQESAGEVKAWAKTATKNFGMSESAALEATALFGDMGTSMGLTNKEAAAMATELAGLAGDLSSFKNIGIDQSMTALKGIFTGETESLKTLGVVMTETNLKQFADDMGLVYSSMSQAEKVTLRFQYVLANTKNAQGDYARTADGAANSLRTMAAEASNLGAAFGKEILPYITPLIQKATDLIRKFSELDSQQKNNIIRMAAFAAGVGPVLTVVGKLTSGIGSAVETGGKFVEWLGKATNGQIQLAGAIPMVGTAMAAAVATAALMEAGFRKIREESRKLNSDLYAAVDAANSATSEMSTAGKELGSAFDNANDSIDTVIATSKRAEDIADELADLASKSKLTTSEQRRMKALVAEMNYIYPEFNGLIDENTGKLNKSAEEVRAFVEEASKMAKISAYQQAINDITKQLSEAYIAQAKAEMEVERANSELAASQSNLTARMQELLNKKGELTAAEKYELGQLMTGTNAYTAEGQAVHNAAKAQVDYNNENKKLTEQTEEAQGTIDVLTGKLDELTGGLEESTGSMESTATATESTGMSFKNLAEFVSTGTQKLKESGKEILDFYNQSHESAKESIMGQASLWDELEEQEATSIANMRANLQQHIQAYANWNSNATKLMSSTEYQTNKNFRAMVDHLVAAGQDMAPELQAIVDAYEAGDEELSALTDDYGELSKLADQTASTTALAETNLKYGLNNLGVALNTSGVPKSAQQMMSKTFQNFQTGWTNIKKGFTNSGVPQAGKKMMSDTGDAIQNYDLGKPTTMAVRTIGNAKPEAERQGRGISDAGTTGVKSGQPGFENAASGAGGSAVQQMASAIKNAEAKTHNAANDIYNGVSSVFGNLASQGKTWGGHLGEGFAQGLASQANSIWNQARTIAQGVKNILGHSTPKEGPLHGDDVWGEHLAQNFASGMIKGVSGVKEAAMDLAAAAVLPTRTLMNIDAVSGRNVAEPLTVNDIYDAFSAAISEQETKIVIGNREFGRILRDQGVA